MTGFNIQRLKSGTKLSGLKNHKWFLLSCVLFFLPLVSCGDGKLIPEKEFISILTDMYLSKSYFASDGIPDARWQDTIPYNRHIVERYGYEWAQFDSTVSWYCKHPKQYQDVYDLVIAQLSEMDKLVSEELDPPSELWTGKKEWTLPIDGRRDSVPVNVLLKGVGRYIVSARIRVYPEDKSVNPRIALYWWRSDTTALGVRDTFWVEPIRKDGLMLKYSIEKTLLPGTEFTHIKGNWLQNDPNPTDTTWAKRAEIKDISVYHIPKKFD